MGVGPAQGQQFIPPCDYSQFVPLNAVIVGALIGAVTAAHPVPCCCVTATLRGCALKPHCRCLFQINSILTTGKSPKELQRSCQMS